MKKIDRKVYILTLFCAFSIAGYINIMQYMNSSDFIAECIYNVLSFVVISLPIFAIVEGMKNGIKGINGKKIFLLSFLIALLILGGIVSLDNVYLLFGDGGVLYTITAFIIGTLLIIFENYNLKDLKWKRH